MRLGQDDGRISLIFSGWEIDQIIGLVAAARLLNPGWLDTRAVTVEGIERTEKGGRAQQKFSGKIIGASSWGYIRTLVMDTSRGQISIGGENAIIEEVALSSIHFRTTLVPGDLLEQHLFPDLDSEELERKLLTAEIDGRWHAYINCLLEIVNELDSGRDEGGPKPALQIRFRTLATRLKYLPAILDRQPKLVDRAVRLIKALIQEARDGHDGALQMYVCEALAAFRRILARRPATERLAREALGTLCLSHDINVQLAALVAFAMYAVDAGDLIAKLLAIHHKAAFSKNPNMVYLAYTCNVLLESTDLLKGAACSADVMLLRRVLSEADQPFSLANAQSVLETGNNNEKKRFLEDALYYLCHFSGLFSALPRQKPVPSGKVDLVAVLADNFLQPYERNFPIVFEAKALERERAGTSAMRQLVGYCDEVQRWYNRKLGILVTLSGITRDAAEYARDEGANKHGYYLHLTSNELFDLIKRPERLGAWLLEKTRV